MKNKIVLITLAVLVSPSISFAAWWNPLTWFKEKEVEVSVPIDSGLGQIVAPVVEPVDEIAPVSGSAIITSPAPEPKVVEKIVTKIVPVDRIVEKIITVPDPTLIAENNLLKNKIKELESKSDYQWVINQNKLLEKASRESESKYVQCVAVQRELETKIEKSKISTSQTESRQKEIMTEIAMIDLEINKIRAGLYDANICSGNRYCDENYVRPPQWLIDRDVARQEVRKAELQLELSRL